MALSRIPSQALLRSSLSPPAVITQYRHRSNKTHQAQLIEVEIDPSSSSSNSDSLEEVIALGIKTKLEEAIHNIIVRRAAPDWLPFLPGYSYWVPPRSTAVRHPATWDSSGLGAGKSEEAQNEVLTKDEMMSSTSARGWPSSTYFIEGTLPVHQIPSVEEEVKIRNEGNNASSTSDYKDEQA